MVFKIKILFIMEKSNIGGSQITTLNRMKALQSVGIESEVVFYKRGNGEKFFSNVPSYIVGSFHELEKIIEQGFFDLISVIYTRQYVKKIREIFNGVIIYEIRGISGKIKKHLEGFNKNNPFDAIICNAEHLKKWAMNVVKVNIPIFVDWNTIDETFYYREDIAHSSFPKTDEKVIAFIGRVDRNKNWSEFLSIVNNLDLSDLEFWFVFDPSTSPELPMLKKQYQQYDIENKVRLIEKIPYDDMPFLYSYISRSGGCLLSTSLLEGLGNHILEAMACNCPVISSNSLGKNEIITHNKNGLLYETGDINGAKKWLLELLQNKTLRDRVIYEANETIQKKFSKEKYVENYLDIIYFLIKKRNEKT